MSGADGNWSVGDNSGVLIESSCTARILDFLTWWMLNMVLLCIHEKVFGLRIWVMWDAEKCYMIECSALGTNAETCKRQAVKNKAKEEK